MAINLISWIDNHNNLDKLSDKAREHARNLEVNVARAEIEAAQEAPKKQKKAASNG